MNNETPITQWEYCRRVLFTWNEMEEMNRMGRDGWEVCGMWYWYVYFKRPVR